MSLHPLTEALPIPKFVKRLGTQVNRASRRIAARVFESQVKLLRKAESIGGKVNQWLNVGLRKLTSWLGGAANTLRPDVAARHVESFWSSVMGGAASIMGVELGKVAKQSHDDAIATVVTEFKPAVEVAEPVLISVPTSVQPTLTHKTAFDYLNKEFRRPDYVPRGVEEPHGIRKRIDRLLVTPLTAKEKERLVFASGWQKRFLAQTKLGSPNEIAQIVSRGLRDNKTVKEISRDLRGAVNGVKATANRIARHETLHLAHRANMAAWNKLGDLVAGYTVHSQMDNRVRPTHRERNGRTYWIIPEPGQHSVDDMPHPPLEADGSIAHGCRCWVTPVLKLQPDKVQQPTAPLDAEVMSAWFDRAGPREQRAVVGAQAHELASRFGTPTYKDFIGQHEQMLDLPELYRRFFGAEI